MDPFNDKFKWAGNGNNINTKFRRLQRLPEVPKWAQALGHPRRLTLEESINKILRAERSNNLSYSNMLIDKLLQIGRLFGVVDPAWAHGHPSQIDYYIKALKSVILSDPNTKSSELGSLKRYEVLRLIKKLEWFKMHKYPEANADRDKWFAGMHKHVEEATVEARNAARLSPLNLSSSLPSPSDKSPADIDAIAGSTDSPNTKLTNLLTIYNELHHPVDILLKDIIMYAAEDIFDRALAKGEYISPMTQKSLRQMSEDFNQHTDILEQPHKRMDAWWRSGGNRRRSTRRRSTRRRSTRRGSTRRGSTRRRY